MEDNVGTIVIGTKVNNSGLKSGLKETERISKDFDKNNNIETDITINTDDIDEEVDLATQKIQRQLDKKQLRIEKIQTKIQGAELTKASIEDSIDKQMELNKSLYEEYEIWKQIDIKKEEGLKLSEKEQDTWKDGLSIDIEKLFTEVNDKVSRNADELDLVNQKLKEYNLELKIANLEYEELSKKINKTKTELIDMGDHSVKIDWGDNPEYAEVAGNVWERFQAGNEEIFNEWQKIQNINPAEKIENAIPFQQELNNEIRQETEELKKVNELSDIELDLNTNPFDAKIAYVENKMKQLENIVAGASTLSDLGRSPIEIQKEYSDLALQLDRLKEKQKEWNNETKKQNSILNQIKVSSSSFENGLGKLAKKAGKLGLALLGVRTILSVITKAFNTLSEYNTELANKINNIKLVLAVALEPIINWLVDAIVKLVGYINAFLKAFFGVDLYARASALSSQKIADNMASGASSAKEMKKQLAGFDEMNVLQDNNTSGGGGGGGSSNIPEFKLPEMELPAWMRWLDENRDKLPEMAGLVAGIISPPVGGLILFTDGLTNLRKALDAYEEEPTFDNFAEMVHRAGETVTGFGMIVGDAPIQIAGSFMAISGLLAQNKGEIDKWVSDIVKDIDKQAKWLDENVSSTLGAMWENLGTDIQYAKDDFFGLMEEAQIDFDGISRTIQKLKEGDIKGAWNEIENWITKKWSKEKERFDKAVDKIKDKLTNLWEGIKKDFAKVTDWIKQRWEDVKNFFGEIGVKIGDAVGGAVKGAVNGALNWIENRINDFISMINNAINLINKIPGVSIRKLSYISLPRLATGGIINQPGRGVPVGGAIAGEAGREGILPLTDERAMAQLGREIGRWITVNATIPVSVGNRQIAREVRQFMADQDFATNR